MTPKARLKTCQGSTLNSRQYLLCLAYATTFNSCQVLTLQRVVCVCVCVFPTLEGRLCSPIGYSEAVLPHSARGHVRY